MNTNLKIKPFPMSYAHSVVIGEAKVNFELGIVTVPISLCREDGTAIETRHVKLEGEDYQAWENDDKYVIYKALDKLGVKLHEAKVIDAKASDNTNNNGVAEGSNASGDTHTEGADAAEGEKGPETSAPGEAEDPAAEKKSKKKGKG
ncbi:MAG: hypothetical protein ABI778_08110 [Ignavibacteriota bacterium]